MKREVTLYKHTAAIITGNNSRLVDDSVRVVSVDMIICLRNNRCECFNNFYVKGTRHPTLDLAQHSLKPGYLLPPNYQVDVSVCVYLRVSDLSVQIS